jgi:hypothetical protein
MSKTILARPVLCYKEAFVVVAVVAVVVVAVVAVS